MNTMHFSRFFNFFEINLNGILQTQDKHLILYLIENNSDEHA